MKIKNIMKNNSLVIIAGPCSVDEHNRKELYEIAGIEVTSRAGARQRAVAGARVVGLKSRMFLNVSGEGMGIDYAVFQENTRQLIDGGGVDDFALPPSVEIARQLVEDTGMMAASEVMDPAIQLAPYEGRVGQGKLFLWNPAVNQLGWQVACMAEYARRNGWKIGLKNPKWVGEALASANARLFTGQTSMEKTWAGLASFAQRLENEPVLIHRGVDVAEKGRYRNVPAHEIARRVKLQTGCKLYFDPSHSYGPKMREEIVPAVIEAMKMNIADDQYLYDGILVEAGTSKTDTEQHITLQELGEMAGALARFRDLVSPEEPSHDDLALAHKKRSAVHAMKKV